MQMQQDIDTHISAFRHYLLKKDEGAKPPYLDVYDVEDMFHELLKTDEVEVAQELLSYARSLHPDELLFDQLLIELMLEQGEASEALRLLRKYPDQNDLMIDNYYISAYAQLGKIKLARSYADKLCKRDDFDPTDGYYNIGVSFQEADMMEDALHYYLLAEKYDSSAEIYCDIAHCYMTLNDEDNAIAYIDKSIKINPFSDTLWLEKADMCMTFKRPADVLKAAEYAIAINPEEERAWFYKLGAQLLLGQEAEAETTAKYILNHFDIDGSHYSLIAGIYADSEKYDEAYEYYLKSEELPTENPIFAELYCKTLLNTKHYQQLIDFITANEHLVELNEAILGLSVDAYRELGQLDKAAELCNRHQDLFSAKIALSGIYIDTGQTGKALELAQSNLRENESAVTYIFAAEAAWYDKQEQLSHEYLKKASKYSDESLKIAHIVCSEMVETLFPDYKP